MKLKDLIPNPYKKEDFFIIIISIMLLFFFFLAKYYLNLQSEDSINFTFLLTNLIGLTVIVLYYHLKIRKGMKKGKQEYFLVEYHLDIKEMFINVFRFMFFLFLLWIIVEGAIYFNLILI